MTNERICWLLRCIALVAIFRGIKATNHDNETLTEFEGGLRIICTNGTCTFNEECANLDTVPGVLTLNASETEYTDISGEIVLEPSSCRAECSGCTGVPGSDKDVGGCIGSAGFVYCPETDECMRPWESNCPFEGVSFIGPVNIICSRGARCNNLSKECNISVGSYTIGGLYLDGLIGTYTLPEGCAAVCEGCYCENCLPEGNSEGGSSDLAAPAWAIRRNVSWQQRALLGFSILVLL